MAAEAQSFEFTSGTPKSFSKNDRPRSPTQHFCEICGVHLTARSERAPSAVLIKVATHVPQKGKDSQCVVVRAIQEILLGSSQRAEVLINSAEIKR